MQITLEIPDPKFKAGDIVQIANEYNDRCVCVKILQVTMNGVWIHNSALITTALVKSGLYLTWHLYPSWTDSEIPKLLDGDMAFDIGKLDQRGELNNSMADHYQNIYEGSEAVLEARKATLARLG